MTTSASILSDEEIDLSEFEPKATNPLMAKIEALVAERSRIVEWLEKYEGLIVKAKKRINDIEQKELTELMDECGQDECRLKSSGIRVQIIENLFASIPAQTTIEKCKDEDEQARLQEQRDKAMTWLDANAPDVVTRNFNIQFSKEDNKLADKFERDLAQRKKPVPVVRSCSVHPQTLTKLVRDRKEMGEPMPEDLFGVYTKRVAKIVLPG